MEITITGSLSKENIIDIAKEVARIININSPKKEIQEFKFYTRKEVSKITNQHVNTISDHIEKKLLIAEKTGKKYQISQENLNLYILKNE